MFAMITVFSAARICADGVFVSSQFKIKLCYLHTCDVISIDQTYITLGEYTSNPLS